MRFWIRLPKPLLKELNQVLGGMILGLLAVSLLIDNQNWANFWMIDTQN